MLYYVADPRDGGAPSTDPCNVCCCQRLSLSPGETNLVMINYLPWTGFIGGPGVVPGMKFDIEHNDSACVTGTINGFTDPSNTNYQLSTAMSTPLAIDLSVNEAPPGNTFNYRILTIYGPFHGTIVQVGIPGSPQFLYTPNGGWTGYDYFAYEMTDAQGRNIIRTVKISVGSHFSQPNLGFMSSLPFINQQSGTVDQRQQLVRFSITMPVSVRKCESFRLTIRQPARDCDGNCFFHQMCFDIIPKDCG